MRIALVDSNPRPKVYPLPLLKIGAWRKNRGDDCQLFNNRLPKAGEFDEIWITTTFTYDIPHAAGIVREAQNRAKQVRVGGISATLMPERFKKYEAKVHRGLMEEAEKYRPDYSLLESAPEYSITHTSRGCVRKCGFCMVHRLEPKFINCAEWREDLHPRAGKVLFYDNNWLAKKREDLEHDVKTIKRLISQGKIREVDFNQGLDARLMTEELADMLRGLPINPVRFAFDGMHEDGYYQRAVEMMAKRGHKDFMTYVLYNFKDTPQDFYYRLRESVRLASGLGVSVGSFPMRYQPIMSADASREYIGCRWTVRKKKGFMNILNHQSIGGAVTYSNLQEFEYWFGKSAEEFDRLLSYPKLRQLVARKKGALRMKRAKGGGATPTCTLQI